jgi:hypothetical protein
LKKITAILFLTALLVLQYGKQWQYLQCKIINTISTEQCDCEKKFTATADDNSTNFPAEKKITPTIPDEYFVAAEKIMIQPITQPNIRRLSFCNIILCNGALSSLLKPPQQYGCTS